MKITCVLYKSLQSVRAAALIGAAMGGVFGKKKAVINIHRSQTSQNERERPTINDMRKGGIITL